MSRTTLILGASSDLGHSIARAIDADDSIIIAHCRSGCQALEDLAGELHGNLHTVSGDFEEEDAAKRIIEASEAIIDVPDGIVVLPAPPLEFRRLRHLQVSEMRRHLDVQLLGPYEVLRHFLPQMGKRKRGRVVFVLSSVTIGKPPKALTHYTTAKYGLLGLMRSLAVEFASKGVTVNAVSPSMVETKFISGIPAMVVKMAADNNPTGRNATPTDVAPAVAFLLSEGSGYINGVNIPISGGSEM